MNQPLQMPVSIIIIISGRARGRLSKARHGLPCKMARAFHIPLRRPISLRAVPRLQICFPAPLEALRRLPSRRQDHLRSMPLTSTLCMTLPYHRQHTINRHPWHPQLLLLHHLARLWHLLRPQTTPTRRHSSTQIHTIRPSISSSIGRPRSSWPTAMVDTIKASPVL